MRIAILVMLFMPVLLLAFADVETEMNRVEALIHAEKIVEAYDLAMQLQSDDTIGDSWLPIVLSRCIDLGGYLGYQHQQKGQFEQALHYNLAVYDLILKNKALLSEEEISQEYVLANDILEAYYSMGDFVEADKYRKLMYQAFGRNELPNSYKDRAFWFDFFREGKYSARGFEIFDPLPVDRFSSSFSKIIYYVNSTKKDGSDDKELFQLHILMFHSSTANFDYVMTWRKFNKKGFESSTLYQYTYDENIDYVKLHSDIREAVKAIIKEMK